MTASKLFFSTEDEDYISSEDSDFLPQTHPQISEQLSSDDDESQLDEVTTKNLRRKRLCLAKEEDRSDFDASGDEVVIALSKKNIREGHGKKKKSVMTRSMHALRKEKEKESKNLPVSNCATIDIEAVWQAMISGNPLPSSSPSKSEQSNSFLPPLSSSCTNSKHGGALEVARQNNEVINNHESKPQRLTGNLAGSKLQFLANSKPSITTVTSSDSKLSHKRPPRLARRSRFEPINENLHPRDDLHFSIRKKSHLIEKNISEPIKKLNTVEKSAIDWSTFVDKEGIAEELDAAGKSKGAYKVRQEFLARVEQKKEEASRKSRGLPV